MLLLLPHSSSPAVPPSPINASDSLPLLLPPPHLTRGCSYDSSACAASPGARGRMTAGPFCRRRARAYGRTGGVGTRGPLDRGPKRAGVQQKRCCGQGRPAAQRRGAACPASTDCLCCLTDAPWTTQHRALQPRPARGVRLRCLPRTQPRLQPAPQRTFHSGMAPCAQLIRR